MYSYKMTMRRNAKSGADMDMQWSGQIECKVQTHDKLCRSVRHGPQSRPSGWSSGVGGRHAGKTSAAKSSTIIIHRCPANGPRLERLNKPFLRTALHLCSTLFPLPPHSINTFKALLQRFPKLPSYYHPTHGYCPKLSAHILTELLTETSVCQLPPDAPPPSTLHPQHIRSAKTDM